MIASLGRILVPNDEPGIRSFAGSALNGTGFDLIKTVRGEGYQLIAR